MEKKFKLGVIGAGFMSGAIIDGVISSGAISPNQIIASDINNTALDRMSKKGVSVTDINSDIFLNSEYVLLAIKPQSFKEIGVKTRSEENFKIISIMAGVLKANIKRYYPNAAVARCMPNTPCSVGYGAVGIDASDFTAEKDAEFVKTLFSSFSKVVFLDENMLNVVTGVSGSGPAYFYLFLKGIIDAGIKRGLSPEAAKLLACNTMIGSGIMVLNNHDKSLDELIDAVCSKGGTTIEAIKVFKENGLTETEDKAVEACIKRAAELEKEV